jgi:hypothetical protein
VKKRVFSLFAFVAVFSLFAGCSKVSETLGALSNGGESEESNQDYEDDAEKLSSDVTFYNAFLGISYTVPKGCWLYSVNSDNFEDEEGGAASEINLDIFRGEDVGYSYANIDLLSFGTLQYSNKINHLGFDLAAELVEGVNSIGGFMEYYEKYMLEPEEDADYELEDSDQVTIKGIPFEQRKFLVDREEDDFYILSYTTKVKNNYYLTIDVSYWPENTDAERTIVDTIGKGLAVY